ncbi:MAG: RNA pseudouridine synthase [Coprobacillus sp.]
MIVGEAGIHIKDIISILMKNNLGNIKQCRTLIKHKHVFINDICIEDIHYLVDKDDRIIVDGKEIDAQPFVYYMLNKPKGYLSASYDKDNLCISDIVKRDGCHCIGRLDKDTTGFLLVTNDKTLSKQLLLPKYHIEKKYIVTTRLPIDKSLVTVFKKGVIIDKDIKCQRALLEIIDDHHCYVTLHEGKYHQVKKMFLSCCNEVIELKRTEFASIELDSSLKEGEYRQLTETELNILYKKKRG